MFLTEAFSTGDSDYIAKAIGVAGAWVGHAQSLIFHRDEDTKNDRKD